MSPKEIKKEVGGAGIGGRSQGGTGCEKEPNSRTRKLRERGEIFLRKMPSETWGRRANGVGPPGDDLIDGRGLFPRLKRRPLVGESNRRESMSRERERPSSLRSNLSGDTP